MEELKRVIAANRAAVKLARDLNVRAGEMLFPIPDRATLAQCLAEMLGGARRASEVSDLDSLRLPEPDAELAQLVMEENPDQIELLGEKLSVEYGEGRAPRVELSDNIVETHRWRELPDVLRLPGGRAVEVVLTFGWYDKISGTDLSQLKAQARARANRAQWEDWDKPELSVPDLALNTVLPEITTAQYGACVVDGTSLKAFGTFVPCGYNPYFWTKWFQTQEEAETAHASSAAKFEELRKEALEQKAIDEARAAAEAARERCSAAHSYDLEYELRSRLDARRYSYALSTLDELQTWTAETLALAAEAEAALKTITDRKAVEETERLATAARRDGILEKIQQMPCPRLHVLVEAGRVFISTGKKVDGISVSPSKGMIEGRPESLDERGRLRYWGETAPGQRVAVRDYSWKGNTNWEETFILPNLTDGVWGVGVDCDDRRVFYPVIFYREGREIVPVEVVEIEEPIKAPKPVHAPPPGAKPASTESVSATLSALQGKFAKKR